MAARPTPYQNTCQRRPRRALTKMLRRGMGGLRRGVPSLVIGKEYLLQARLLRAQVDDRVAGDRLERRVEVVAHLDVEGAAVPLDLAHTGEPEGVRRDGRGERHLDDVQRPPLEG